MFNQKLIPPILTGIVFLLILLWVYTAASKLVDFNAFERELANQAFSRKTAQILLWVIPTVELVAAFLLLLNKTRLAGLTFSFFLLLLFTGYVALVLADYYDRVPCSCGGVLKQLDWQAHFWFNLFCLGINTIGLLLVRKQHKNEFISAEQNPLGI